MYFVALVAARLVLKWFYSNVRSILAPVRAFRDDRLALLAVDDSLRTGVLNRCADMQRALISGHPYASFFAAPRPATVESCGEASSKYLNYVDVAIAAIIGLQIAGVVVSIIKYQCCERRGEAHEDAFPSPPSPPESPPPSDRALKKNNADVDDLATKTVEPATLRQRKIPVVYGSSDNMDV